MLFPKKILLGLQEGSCNLKCPKCYTHGTNKISDNLRPKGIMDFSSFKGLVAELALFKPRVAPQTWDEPLLNSGFFSYIEELKRHDLSITMDTNGLLLTEEKMKNLIQMKVDSVFISLDAFRSETYRKVRGVDKLAELKEKMLTFIKIRGRDPLPRIGVSFVKEAENQNEVEDFISFWMDHVDVVRVNEKFAEKRSLSPNVIASSTIKSRQPCWSLYDSLMVHFNGEASMCCVDTHYENKIGNVFSDGVLNVWNGNFFKGARERHANLNFEKLPTCSQCELWRHDQPQNTILGNWLISQTTTHSYFNRRDRIDNMLENRFV